MKYFNCSPRALLARSVGSRLILSLRNAAPAWRFRELWLSFSLLAACSTSTAKATPFLDQSGRDFYLLAAAGPSEVAECQFYGGVDLSPQEFESGDDLAQGAFALRLKSNGSSLVGVSYGVEGFLGTTVLKTCGFPDMRK